MTLPQAQETTRNHHVTLDGLGTYLTGGELIVTTVRNHYDTIVSWWFLNNCHLPLSRFVSEYRHSFYAKRNKLWWLHENTAQVVMRYETLQSDLDLVLVSLGFDPIQLTHVNVTGKKDSYLNHISDGFLKAVNSRFGEEIKYYGYEYE